MADTENWLAKSKDGIQYHITVRIAAGELISAEWRTDQAGVSAGRINSPFKAGEYLNEDTRFRAIRSLLTLFQENLRRQGVLLSELRKKE